MNIGVAGIVPGLSLQKIYFTPKAKHLACSLRSHASCFAVDSKHLAQKITEAVL